MHPCRYPTSPLPQLSLDDYDTIRLINYIRRSVAAGTDPRPALEAAVSAGAGAQRPWGADEFLAPVIDDDPLLGYDYDEDAAEEGWVSGWGQGWPALCLDHASWRNTHGTGC
jgi:hypothetical protein